MPEIVIYCMYAINQVSTFGIPYAVPHTMDNEVQTKDPGQGCCAVPENETSGGTQILSRMGIYHRGDRDGSCASAHGDTAEIRSKHSGRGAEEEYKQRTEQEVSFPERLLLGW